MIGHLRIAAAISATLLVVSCGGRGRTDLAIVHANLVDVVAGEILTDRTVLIRGDRIQAVGPSIEIAVPSGARVVDATGKYMITGLWDMHVHALWDERVARTFLPLFVANGVTGIRDMGGSTAVRAAARDLARAGEMVSPRVVAAGPFVDGIDFYPGLTIVASDEEEGRAAVDSLVSVGADFVKVYTQLPKPAFLGVVDRARELNVDVVGHVPAEVTPAEASAVGFRSIEHLRDEIEPLCAPVDPGECAELFGVFGEHDTWQTPTLVVLRAKASLKDSSIVFDERHRYVPEVVRDEWSASRNSKMNNVESYFVEKTKRFTDEQWLVGTMHDADVRILAGSDAGSLYSVPGFALHDELELLVRSGLDAAAALRAATSNAASFLGMEDSVGTIESGKIADLLILRENPLEDVRHTRAIESVVVRGALITRRDLDSILHDTWKRSNPD